MTNKRNRMSAVLVSGILAMVMAMPLAAARLGVLEGVLKPQMIQVHGGELFVAEGQYIHVFSLPDMKKKFRIGKDGEGPGEFKLDPARTIIFSVHPEFILAESRNKIVYFDRSGGFLKEKRKSPGILQVLPLGGNYAVLRLQYGAGGESYFVASVMDPEFKEIRGVYRQKFFNFKGKINALPDGLNIAVVRDHLWVEESPGGFVIEVFDSQGNRVRKIERKAAPVAVTAAHKRRGLEDLMKIPALRRAVKEQGRAKVLNDLSPNLVYPEYLPAIGYIKADGDVVYVNTPRREDGRIEFLRLDAEGKIVSSRFLPAGRQVDFLVRMQGDKNYFTIHNGTYYYLQFMETEDDEAWILNAESLE